MLPFEPQLVFATTRKDRAATISKTRNGLEETDDQRAFIEPPARPIYGRQLIVSWNLRFLKQLSVRPALTASVFLVVAYSCRHSLRSGQALRDKDIPALVIGSDTCLDRSRVCLGPTQSG